AAGAGCNPARRGTRVLGSRKIQSKVRDRNDDSRTTLNAIRKISHGRSSSCRGSNVAPIGSTIASRQHSLLDCCRLGASDIFHVGGRSNGGVADKVLAL